MVSIRYLFLKQKLKGLKQLTSDQTAFVFVRIPSQGRSPSWSHFSSHENFSKQPLSVHGLRESHVSVWPGWAPIQLNLKLTPRNCHIPILLRFFFLTVLNNLTRFYFSALELKLFQGKILASSSLTNLVSRTPSSPDCMHTNYLLNRMNDYSGISFQNEMVINQLPFTKVDTAYKLPVK